MKSFIQILGATILAALCAPAIAAEATGHTVTYSVKIMQGKELVSSNSLVTRDGIEVLFARTQEDGYLASCTADDGKTQCKHDTITTGLSMTFRPEVKKDGGIATHFVMAASGLDSIQTFSANGMTTQLPQISRDSLEGTVMLASGKTIELPFGPLVDRDNGVGLNKYMVAITATLVD